MGGPAGLRVRPNNIYYFELERRPKILRTSSDLLTPDGEILLTTMTRPGSVASAHLHLMLVSQGATASLPEVDALLADFGRADLEVISVEHPVPIQPYLVMRAVPRRQHHSRS